MYGAKLVLSTSNQFGLPVDEHRKSIQINIFDGYTVFTVPDESAPPAPTT
mgnify:CR=1 FL=1